MSAPRRIVDTEGARKADLASIHIAKKALGWDDDTYRDILWTVCKVRSSGALDFAGRKRFLAHLQACGWSGGARASAGARSATRGGSRKPWGPQQRLVFSLWQQLADRGLVESRTSQSMNAWVKRQSGVDLVDWLTKAQADLVITSLKGWLKRGREVA